MGLEARASWGWLPSAGCLFSAQAVTDMNGKEVSGRLLYVGRAQKRVERQNELKRRFEQMKQDRLTRYQVRVSLREGSCFHVKVSVRGWPSLLQQSHFQELACRDGGERLQLPGDGLSDGWGAWVLRETGN